MNDNNSGFLIFLFFLWLGSFFFIQLKHENELDLQKKVYEEKIATMRNVYFEDYCRYIDFNSNICSIVKNRIEEEEKRAEKPDLVMDVINNYKKESPNEQSR